MKPEWTIAMDDLDTIPRADQDAIAESLGQKAERLAEEFDARAAEHDAGDRFVAENYVRMGAEGLLSAGVPAEQGGGGADQRDLSEMLRRLAHGCGSTARALAMHSHQVAIPAWRLRHQPAAKAAVEPVLMRAAGGAVLLSSGGSDWVGSSGRAEKVEGGYKIHARKVFASGSPAGTLLVTSAIAGDKVIHFALPFDAPEVKRLDTWRAMGMRGTGSGDVEIDGFFLPDDKVALTRPAGEWHPIWVITATLAFPLIYAVYLGVAEAMRDLAVAQAAKRPDSANRRLIGELDTALWAARVAQRAMIEVAEENAPTPDTVNRVMFGRRQVEVQALRVADLAMELAGGAGFYRAMGLERRFRDIQGARYHPMKRDTHMLYAGTLALGEPVARVF
jgi:alkylation response protein AidB-like acyl-CoA dehydrogenase